jgi:hypothetical protein
VAQRLLEASLHQQKQSSASGTAIFVPFVLKQCWVSDLILYTTILRPGTGEKGLHEGEFLA